MIKTTANTANLIFENNFTRTYMSTNEYLVWSRDRLLSWSDYRADPNPSIYEDANSYIKYNCTWIVDSKEIDGKINFFIEDIKLDACFYPRLSWVRSVHATEQLLKHEQGHFDLAEMIRTELLSILQNYFRDKYYTTRGQNQEQQKQFAREDSGTLVFKQLEVVQSILDQKRKEYDQITEYGYNVDKQHAYDQMFASLR